MAAMAWGLFSAKLEAWICISIDPNDAVYGPFVPVEFVSPEAALAFAGGMSKPGDFAPMLLDNPELRHP